MAAHRFSSYLSVHSWILATHLLLGVDAGIRYRAAVVEISPTGALPATRQGAWAAQLRNVEAMDGWVWKASQQGAQIVVFPEDYLDSGVALTPDLTPLYSEQLPEPGPRCLCNPGKPSSIVQAVACIAQKHGVIVVSGIGDVGPCSTHVNPFNNKSFHCDLSTGLARYNAMVAIGRDGQLLGKYRKAHLADTYSVPEMEPWAELDKPEVVTFDSHFGVRFGMLICNDANFGGPTQGILKQGVRDIVFSTYWINTSPLWMAASFQDAYSRSHGVNFIAANSDGQGFASSGSGIWPADTSVKALQHFNRTFFTPPSKPIFEETAGWLGILDLESPSVQKPVPAAVSHPAKAAALGDKGTVKVAVVTPNANGAVHVSSSVLGVTCQLDGSIMDGDGRFGLIAFAGIFPLGYYSAGCSVVSCPDGMDTVECVATLTSCVSGFSSPMAGACEQSLYAHPDAWARQAPRLGDVHLRIQAPEANTFLPLVVCSDYLAPEPRSMVSVDDVAFNEQVLHVAGGACNGLGAYTIEARAQSESEEPERRGTSVRFSALQRPQLSVSVLV